MFTFGLRNKKKYQISMNNTYQIKVQSPLCGLGFQNFCDGLVGLNHIIVTFKTLIERLMATQCNTIEIRILTSINLKYLPRCFQNRVSTICLILLLKKKELKILDRKSSSVKIRVYGNLSQYANSITENVKFLRSTVELS